MPRFGELVAIDIWTTAARTLTDISAEAIYDLPLLMTSYGVTTVTTSATPNAFGAWVEITASVGNVQRLIWAIINLQESGTGSYEFEFGQGAAGSEVTIARLAAPHRQISNVGYVSTWVTYLWRSLSANVRLAVRVRNDEGVARATLVSVGYA